MIPTGPVSAEKPGKPAKPGPGNSGFGGFAGFVCSDPTGRKTPQVRDSRRKTSAEAAPNPTPAAWLRALLEHLGAGRIGRLYQCPAHADDTPSLSIRDLPDGWAGIKCFHGCATSDILASLRLTRQVLARPMLTPPDIFAATAELSITFPPVKHPTRPGLDPAWRFETAHDYGDRWRLLRFRHPSGAKDLRWETLDQAGAWIPGLRGVPASGLPLYLEREARMAVAVGDPVHLIESESSADALAGRGLYATTWAGGASSPPLAQLVEVLSGAHVVLIPDNDPPGLACAERITLELQPVTDTFRVVMPDPGQDARDLLATDPQRITRRTL